MFSIGLKHNKREAGCGIFIRCQSFIVLTLNNIGISFRSVGIDQLGRKGRRWEYSGFMTANVLDKCIV